MTVDAYLVERLQQDGVVSLQLLDDRVGLVLGVERLQLLPEHRVLKFQTLESSKRLIETT